MLVKYKNDAPTTVTESAANRNVRYRAKKKAIEQSIIDEYNQIGDLPVVSWTLPKSSCKGRKRPAYNPPDEEMKGMTQKQISEWRRNEKRKRKAMKMRECRAKKAAMLKSIKDKVEENKQKMIAATSDSVNVKDKVEENEQKITGNIEAVKPAMEAKTTSTQAIGSDHKPSNSHGMIEHTANALDIGYLDDIDIDSFMDDELIEIEDTGAEIPLLELLGINQATLAACLSHDFDLTKVFDVDVIVPDDDDSFPLGF
ncbi:hypothetical protein ACHAWO_004981 [Cyclotella atomus]|uniref:Uncharacterized protein n=1 Tax=Cyclotella atomus TaxID=382360 RepID=A0ABD3PU64_9STRA